MFQASNRQITFHLSLCEDVELTEGAILKQEHLQYKQECG